jgi:hypothetical protein
MGHTQDWESDANHTIAKWRKLQVSEVLQRVDNAAKEYSFRSSINRDAKDNCNQSRDSSAKNLCPNFQRTP